MALIMFPVSVRRSSSAPPAFLSAMCMSTGDSGALARAETGGDRTSSGSSPAGRTWRWCWGWNDAERWSLVRCLESASLTSIDIPWLSNCSRREEVACDALSSAMEREVVVAGASLAQLAAATGTARVTLGGGEKGHTHVW